MTAVCCAVDGCDRPVKDASVCGGCASRLETALGDVPALAEELDTTLSRQAVIGDRNGGKSAETPLVFHYQASEVGYVLRNTLVGWVRDLASDDLGIDCGDTVAGMARWLLARTDRLRVHPAGGEAVEEITSAVRDVWRVVDRAKRRFVIGPCVMTDCAGTLTVTLAAESGDESWITCDSDDEHAWPEERWLFLGNWIHNATMVG